MKRFVIGMSMLLLLIEGGQIPSGLAQTRANVAPGVTAPSAENVIDPRSPQFGAHCDWNRTTGANDTAAIQAAINAASRNWAKTCGYGGYPATQSCTSVVQINGMCGISSLFLPSDVVLRGNSRRTDGLFQIAGSNAPMITVAGYATERVEIRDLYLNGNASQQTGAWDCIHFDSTGAHSDRDLEVEDVFVENCSGSGIYLTGDAGSDRLLDVISYSNGQYGLYINVYDTVLDNIEGGMNGYQGIYFDSQGSNAYLSNSKFWYNGSKNKGSGVYSLANRVLISNVDAQDNYGDGFDFSGSSLNATGLLADNNGKAAGSDHVAVSIFGLTNSYIQYVATNFQESAGGKSAFALYNSTLPKYVSSGNVISVVASNMTKGFSSGAPTTGNIIVSNAAVGSKQ